MTRLNDDDLMNVAGGFTEQADIPTKGMEIRCPICKKGNTIKPEARWDPKMGSVEYACNCGTIFVCYGKEVILKERWIEMCKSKGYIYPFA